MKIPIHHLHQREVEAPDHNGSHEQAVDDVGFARHHADTLTCGSRRKRTMHTREFGFTGKNVPVIGQGTWQMKKGGLYALRAGIDLGMTHIDTAEMYSGAEEIVGEAIRGRRKEIFLVSKVLPSNASYRGTLGPVTRV